VSVAAGNVETGGPETLALAELSKSSTAPHLQRQRRERASGQLASRNDQQVRVMNLFSIRGPFYAPCLRNSSERAFTEDGGAAEIFAPASGSLAAGLPVHDWLREFNGMENFERANTVFENALEGGENCFRFVHGVLVGMLEMLSRRWKGRIHFR